MSHWQAQLLSGPLWWVAMEPEEDGEDIFPYSRLRRAYSSKTEIYQIPLLGSCLPSGSCTESVRADRKRKQKTENGSSPRAIGIRDHCPLQFIHWASQISAISSSVKYKVGKDRAVTRRDIRLSGVGIGCLEPVEAVWSWFFHCAAHGQLPVAVN